MRETTVNDQPSARVAAVLDPLVRLTPARLRTELRRYAALTTTPARAAAGEQTKETR